MRPELKPLLDYLARLTFQDLMREVAARPPVQPDDIGKLEERPSPSASDGPSALPGAAGDDS